ncbi:hypothetical protein [Demequina lignilytica]|uniref:Transcriptional regulator, AbiEi antitoxin, Type IV TA system n=1 Tax=Demequina lignilytica TaxID=3051663 RepID=A0AB35MHV5_9MICO|nr:hypothetical protein [Demequina sp. SYSU T0a273]MDN4483369.1 hypothetical protein [Demequina sp. SYSU T0a273]
MSDAGQPTDGPGARAPFDSPQLWRALVGDRSAAAPVALPLFSTRDALAAGLTARRLTSLRSRRRVETIARGRHILIPPGASHDWRIAPLEAAWLVAVSVFGWDLPYLSGLTAAACHGAIAHPPGVVHITGPSQVRDIDLPGVGCIARFHQRSERTWSESLGAHHGDPAAVDIIAGELCRMRITTENQTCLDLEHSLRRTGYPRVAAAARLTLQRRAAYRALWDACQLQRRWTAYGRLTGWRSQEPIDPRESYRSF